MMTEEIKMINAQKNDNTLLIKSPYNSDFVDGARDLGGEWNPDCESWSFPIWREEAVSLLCARVYGVAISEMDAAPVNVRITARSDIKCEKGPVMFAGRVLVKAFGRDSGAFMGDGCALISGEKASGGSVKNWCTIIREGAVLEMMNVLPAQAIDDDNWSVEIITPPSASALRDERARLVARIAEIDAMIGN
jgi:hypothetical protein